MSRPIFGWAPVIAAVALSILAGPFGVSSGGHAAAAHAIFPLAPRPLVGGVAFVRAAAFTGGTNGASVTATINATRGDTLYAFGGEGFAVSTPALNDSRLFTWTVNYSHSFGGLGIVLGHANVTTAGLDTVTFADSGSGALTLGVWDVSGSAGRFAHEGNGSTGTGVSSLADSVWVHNVSGLIGFFDVATRATGGCSNAADPGLTYAVGASSVSSSDGSCELFAAPVNGTGFKPADGGTNSSTTTSSGIAFTIDPSSAPPSVHAAIASFGPSPCEVGSCRVLFNGTATGGTSPYNFTWTWGDGSFATHDNANSTGSDRTTHTFSSAGRFPVILNVTDATHGFSEAFANVTVRPATAPALATNRTSPCVVPLANATCAAEFNSTLSFGLSSYRVEFLLLNATGHVVDSAFGNSSSTATFNLTHHETLPVGAYNAWFNVTDGSGHAFSAHLAFAVTLPGAGGGVLSGGFDLLLIGSVLVVLAIACVGGAVGGAVSRRRRSR